MKKTLFLLLGIALACSASAQKKQPNGIFFEISGNGLKQPSYILGSNHEVNGSFVHQIPQFDEIYNKVGQTCFETEMGEDADNTTATANQAVANLQQQQQQQDMAKMLILPGDTVFMQVKIQFQKRIQIFFLRFTYHIIVFLSCITLFFSAHALSIIYSGGPFSVCYLICRIFMVKFIPKLFRQMNRVHILGIPARIQAFVKAS